MLQVLKFIVLTIIKMVFVILTLASLILSAFGALFFLISLFNAHDHKEKVRDLRSKGGLTEDDMGSLEYHRHNARSDIMTGSLFGLLATGCFFITKACHKILRKYLWPALGGLAICIAVIVIVEPDFYVEARNFVQQEILNR